MNEYVMKEKFETFGPISDIAIKENGYGFLEFKYIDDAADAVREAHRSNFFGEGLINVEYALSREQKSRRDRSDSRRSRSYSNDSRSRSNDSRDNRRGRMERFNLRPNKRIFIGALPHDVQEADIRREFEKFGPLTDIKLKANYGFV